MMTLIEDDAEINPAIQQSQLNYIRCLTDTHKQYTRFFDALLVPRPSHAAFLRDLKGFRCLPTTIKAFTLCDPDDVAISKEQRKHNYRDVTKRFLGSRFAHPWCRKAMAGTGNTKAGGWWGAEWSATGRKMSREHQEQEDKLHKLLIPIWVVFRGRMFPGEAIVDQWWGEAQLKSSTDQPSTPIVVSSYSDDSDDNEAEVQPGKALRATQSCSSMKSRSNLADDDSQSNEEVVQQQMGTAAVTGLLRLAAAGMLIGSMPKMQQWKLKRELKKRVR